jgi:hypothetical protein
MVTSIPKLYFSQASIFNILKQYKMTTIDLTPEEYVSITCNYPIGNQLYYIWVGILALRGYKLPTSLDGMKIKHIGKFTYSIHI